MPEIPFPARKNGITIRYFPIIAHASKEFDIHLLAICDNPVDEANLALARQWCSRVSVYIRQRKSVSLVKKLFYRAKSLLPIGIPFPYLRYDEEEINQFFARETRGQSYDLALCIMPLYLNLVHQHVTCKRLTMDLIDSAYLNASRNPDPSLLESYDTFLIKKWERRALASVDYACYISPLDRQTGAGENFDPQRIGVIPNGIFLQDDVDEKVDYGVPTIGYIGHMSYPPNIRAALRLAAIYQKRKASLSALKLIIIGRDPAPEIKKLADQEGIVVTGTVDNIWPYIKGVDIFVFPMETGSGQQNKLLEAMAAGKPVISTAVGNSGVRAEHGKELIEANSDEEICQAIAQLVENEHQQHNLGEAGKQFVYSNYYWENIYKSLDKTLLALKP